MQWQLFRCGISILKTHAGTWKSSRSPFEKVFYNLIDNALRYGGTKMTTISLSSREQDTGLIMNVEDDGQGISARDKTQLFERGFGHHTGLGSSFPVRFSR
jgi:signal transduction histidine kinase